MYIKSGYLQFCLMDERLSSIHLWVMNALESKKKL